jgi:hypothetical protein
MQMQTEGGLFFRGPLCALLHESLLFYGISFGRQTRTAVPTPVVLNHENDSDLDSVGRVPYLRASLADKTYFYQKKYSKH